MNFSPITIKIFQINMLMYPALEISSKKSLSKVVGMYLISMYGFHKMFL